MPEFTVTIDTAADVVAAEGGAFDRLIEIVYADDRFGSPALGLNDDGAVTFTFNVDAETWPAATDRATGLVAGALEQLQAAERRRGLVHGALFVAALLLIARIAIERAESEEISGAPEREKVPA
jgi:hypothetical protein